MTTIIIQILSKLNIVRGFVMKKKKTNIDVNNFRDPFTVFSSGFAIIMPAETDDSNETPKSPQIKRWGLFKEKKLSKTKSNNT